MRRLLFLVIAFAVAPVAAAGPAPRPAADAIRLSVVRLMGPEAQVTVTVDDADDTALYREARPNPMAQLGHPMRFTLVAVDGRERQVTANVDVVTSHAVVREPVLRGHLIEAGDVAPANGPITGVPLVRLPDVKEIVGTLALRPLEAGAIVQPSFVKLRRAVEAGDTVTVVALAGGIEVSAQFVAVDGGNVGAVIRARNPESKRFIRARVVGTGQLEVIYER